MIKNSAIYTRCSKTVTRKRCTCSNCDRAAPFMFEDIRKELDIHNYVSFNGQYVVFEDEVIFNNPLHPDALHKFTQFAKQEGYPLVYLDHQDMRASVEYHDYVKEGFGSLNFEHPAYEPNFYEERNIYQTLLFVK